MNQPSERLGRLGVADRACQEAVVGGTLRPGNETAAAGQPAFGLVEFDRDRL
jgi:hypothetical protein